MKIKFVILLIVILFFSGGNVEANFENWTNGIEEVVSETETKYGERIKLAAESHEIKKEILLALVVVESNGDPNAISETGVQGLTMLTKNVVDLIEKKEGIKINRVHEFESLWGAGWYLRYLIDSYDFNLKEAVAAYYHGPSGLREKLKTKELNDLYYMKKINYILTLVN